MAMRLPPAFSSFSHNRSAAPRQHPSQPLSCSIVDEVFGRRRELGVALDHLVDRLDHILLGDRLAARADGKHARLDAHAADVGACAHAPRGRAAENACARQPALQERGGGPGFSDRWGSRCVPAGDRW
eukprot:416202-Prymnesium_polylepis.2